MRMTLLILLILTLASFRITRFIVIDTLPARLRDKFHNFLLAHKLNTLYELTSCTWCSSVWISFFVYWLYRWTRPDYWGRLGWLEFLAVAALAGVLQAFEPDN